VLQLVLYCFSLQAYEKVLFLTVSNLGYHIILKCVMSNGILNRIFQIVLLNLRCFYIRPRVFFSSLYVIYIDCSDFLLTEFISSSYIFIILFYFEFVHSRKTENDEEHKKRRLLEPLDDVFEDVTLAKKARLDLPVVRSL